MPKPSKEAIKRLQKELANITKDPPENIIAQPHPENILEWYYVILGPLDTPYESGVYYGKLTFQPDYPHSPPSICMITPNGRFEPNKRLCLSMSDYHPESWNPSWTVCTILVGLLSFMLENDITAGSIESTESDKRKFAEQSMIFNSQNKLFCQMFPQLVAVDDDNTTDKAKNPS